MSYSMKDFDRECKEFEKKNKNWNINKICKEALPNWMKNKDILEE